MLTMPDDLNTPVTVEPRSLDRSSRNRYDAEVKVSHDHQSKLGTRVEIPARKETTPTNQGSSPATGPRHPKLNSAYFDGAPDTPKEKSSRDPNTNQDQSAEKEYSKAQLQHTYTNTPKPGATPTETSTPRATR